MINPRGDPFTKREVTADDRLRDLGESFLLIEATGAQLATFLVEDIRFLFERIEHFKMSRRVMVADLRSSARGGGG